MLRRLLFWAYRRDDDGFREFILSVVKKLERGDLYSPTLRKIFSAYHDVHIGMYSMGGCFLIRHFDRHTTIGRYCSIATTAFAMNRNHPVEHKSTHAFFYHPALKYVTEDLIAYVPLTIGNDVWIGHNVTIMPGVKSIGDGAVIGAGAVLSKDVPPYAIVLGNPGRVVRYRFSSATIEKLMAEKWWDKSIDELLPHFDEYRKPYEERRMLATNDSARITPEKLPHPEDTGRSRSFSHPSAAADAS